MELAPAGHKEGEEGEVEVDGLNMKGEKKS